MNKNTRQIDCFISTVTQRVLSFLSSHPGEKFHEREISRRIKISMGAANKSVKILWKMRLISRDQRGRMCFYMVENIPIIRIFKALNTILILQPLVSKISGDSHKIVLFGSAADGTNSSKSDIDLFIITENTWKVSKEINNFSDECISGKIQPYVKTPEEMLQEKDDVFYRQIEKGVVLWEAEGAL